MQVFSCNFQCSVCLFFAPLLRSNRYCCAWFMGISTVEGAFGAQEIAVAICVSLRRSWGRPAVASGGLEAIPDRLLVRA